MWPSTAAALAVAAELGAPVSEERAVCSSRAVLVPDIPLTDDMFIDALHPDAGPMLAAVFLRDGRLA